MSLPKFTSTIIKTRRLHIRPLKPADFRVWLKANDDQAESKNRFDPGRRPEATRMKAALKKTGSISACSLDGGSVLQHGHFREKVW